MKKTSIGLPKAMMSEFICLILDRVNF